MGGECWMDGMQQSSYWDGPEDEEEDQELYPTE